MIILLCLLFLLFSFFWPFAGGWRELRLKEDPLPLFINVDYLKEPRYFSLSFRKIFKDILAKEKLKDGLYEIKMSKPETVEVFEGGMLKGRDEIDNLFYVKNSLFTEHDMTFDKEVYVRGNADIGEKNNLRALAGDGQVHLSVGTSVSRWIDAEGTILIENDCDLGISATSAKEIIVGKDCKFKRLYGDPVKIGQCQQPGRLLLKEYPVYDCTKDSTDIKEIKENTINDFSVITVHDLQIGSNSVINGHIKSFGDVVTGDNVIITGNVFSDGSITLGAGCKVLGDVFSQDKVFLSSGTIVGQPGKKKSVIGNSSITSAENVMVYGYVSTDGEGFIL